MSMPNQPPGSPDPQESQQLHQTRVMNDGVPESTAVMFRTFENNASRLKDDPELEAPDLEYPIYAPVYLNASTEIT
jgi:hypothetical protein